MAPGAYQQGAMEHRLRRANAWICTETIGTPIYGDSAMQDRHRGISVLPEVRKREVGI